MGLIYADIELVSGEDLVLHRLGQIQESQIKKIKTKALVDSGAYLLAINENIKNQLDLKKVDEQEMELANGKIEKVEIVGPIDIRFENRRCNCDAVVLPANSEVLLGAIPMEDLDVIIEPKSQTMVVNPESPYLAKKKMK